MTAATMTRWVNVDSPAAFAATAPRPPAKMPRLQRPCRRFITGVCRRALIHEPCRFIEMSTRTSTNR